MSKTIQAILPPKRPGMKTTVVFSDGTAKKYLPDVAAEQGLYPGMDLSDAELSALEAANGSASAKRRAVRIIAAAGVSKQELEQRLTRKGESEADAKQAVEWLSELRLLDDAETARQIVARGVSRGYGRLRIKQMLLEKQIPAEYREAALAELPDMTEALTDFLRKRLGEDPDEKQTQSALQAAIRRGYTWTEVRETLERLEKTDTLEP